jgi:hypothetical protein
MHNLNLATGSISHNGLLGGHTGNRLSPASAEQSGKQSSICKQTEAQAELAMQSSSGTFV